MWQELLIFNCAVLLFLILDLCVFHKNSQAIRLKEAWLWTISWFLLALIFSGSLFFWKNPESSLLFLTAYFVEKSLSIDNIFAFILIFSFFKVPENHKHKILFWGVIGALISRIVFIFVGITIFQHFHFILYLLACFLLLLGIKMIFKKEDEIEIEKNPLLKIVKKILPVTNDYVNGHFFVKRTKKWYATPLFLTLLMIESTDIVFALDSIPAVLAITTDPFLAYTSNIFAILGLRSLYFALAHIIKLFHLLHYALGIILAYVGIKMLLSDIYPISPALSLLIILFVIVLFVFLSLLIKKKEGE